MTERLSKDLILSNEVHSSLFLIKGVLQRKEGKNFTLNEVIKVLISQFDSDLVTSFKLEEKE